MSYEKLGLVKGQVLKAEHINHMEEGIANAGGADWNASEGEAGYIKNRPFYEKVEVVNEPLNITWDGNTEGLVTAYVDGNSAPLYKVFDLTLTNEQIESLGSSSDSLVVTYSDGGIVNISQDWEYLVNEGMVTEDSVFSGDVAIIRQPGVKLEDLMFPEIGIYFYGVGDEFVSSLTTTEPVEATKTELHKIDKKYLPDGIGGTFKVNVSWDEMNSRWVCDKTYTEIKAAEEARMPIVGTFTDKWGKVYTLIGCDIGEAEHCTLAAFDLHDYSALYIYRINVFEDYDLTVCQYYLPAEVTEL